MSGSGGDIDLLVRNFARFLNASWDSALVSAEVGNYQELIPDWLQGNWEGLVEAALRPGIFLEVYGDGADCNERSSRVHKPEVVATNVVVCRPRSGNAAWDALAGKPIIFPDGGLVLDELVSLAGSWYARRPPFDHALIIAAPNTMLFRIDDVLFDLESATSG